jgi:hypothetical protein
MIAGSWTEPDTDVAFVHRSPITAAVPGEAGYSRGAR